LNAKSRAAVDATLAALADPQRRQVVDLLSEKPRAAGDLARALGISPPAMSRHLRALREGGIVAEDHDGLDARVRVYRLRTESMTALKAWLEETERLWSRQLLAFKAHFDKRRK
jgi:DNA-binding transcriptional ArsR family regulator